MSNLTVKELKMMIKKHKMTGAKCKPYSKLKKAQLIEHAKELGLIKTPKGETPEEKRINKNIDSLMKIRDLVDKQELKTKRGKNKKASVLRRIQRVKESIEDGEVQPKVDSFIMKLKKDTDKLLTMM